jgi:hypothetical protein
MKRLLSSSAILLGVLLTFTSAARAESNHDAEREPFCVELTKALPEKAVTATFENGLVTLDVRPSHTLTALGIEGEEFLRIADDGKVSVLTTSMTYEMAELTVETEHNPRPLKDGWSEIGSGKVSYHEHRAHFMASRVDPSIKDGGIVSTFELEFIVDDKPVTVTGNLVFDPKLNPARAEELTNPESGMTAASHNHDHTDMSSTPWFLIVGIPAVFFIAMGGFIVKVRRRSN